MFKSNSVRKSHAAPPISCFSPSFHVQSQFSDSFDSLKNSTPSRSYHTKHLNMIQVYNPNPNTPCILQIDKPLKITSNMCCLFDPSTYGLGAPSALAFGRPSMDNMGTGHQISPTPCVQRILWRPFFNDILIYCWFSRYGPIFNPESKQILF